MATLTEQLVDHVLAVRYDDLPDGVIDMARQVTLDGFAVIMAGYTEPLGLGRIVTEYTREIGGTPQASVIGGGFKTSMPNAAFANGTMAHALDFDNTWYPLNHPTSPTLPVALALAEHYGLSGRAIVEALVAAFEVQGRLRMAATGLETGQGFHKPGTTGTMGAVTAAIKLLRLNRQQAMMAFGIAGSRCCSLALNTGTMTKSSHSGHAARVGLECGLLAQKGFTANADVFGPKGFFDTFMPGNAQPQLLVEDFGRPFRMIDPGVGFKKYPSNYFTHRPIDAALALRARLGLRMAEIDKVRVRFPRFEYINRPQPETGLDGKFSVQYTTAAALIDGDITIDTFTNERRHGSDIADLLPRIELEFDDAIPLDFDRMHAEVTVKLKDGRTVTERVQKLSGWCGFPLTREQRMRKFNACSRRILSEPQGARLAELVEGLDGLPDITDMMTIARAA